MQAARELQVWSRPWPSWFDGADWRLHGERRSAIRQGVRPWDIGKNRWWKDKGLCQVSKFFSLQFYLRRSRSISLFSFSFFIFNLHIFLLMTLLMTRLCVSRGRQISRKVKFPGSWISWVVNFPGKSNFYITHTYLHLKHSGTMMVPLMRTTSIPWYLLLVAMLRHLKLVSTKPVSSSTLRMGKSYMTIPRRLTLTTWVLITNSTARYRGQIWSVI